MKKNTSPFSTSRVFLSFSGTLLSALALGLFFSPPITAWANSTLSGLNSTEREIVTQIAPEEGGVIIEKQETIYPPQKAPLPSHIDDIEAQENFDVIEDEIDDSGINSSPQKNEPNFGLPGINTPFPPAPSGLQLNQ